MALVNNGTKNSLPANQIPSGYSRPSITTFTDYEYVRDFSLSILKSTVENATASTTMTNIIDNATIGIDKQIEDIMNNDFDTTGRTITVWNDLRELETNYTDNEGADDWLTDTAASYVATVKCYIKES